MSLVALIADEVTAAGFRLAGVETRVPGEGEVVEVFRELGGRSRILVLTAEYAARIPAAEMERALSQTAPLILVIPDLRRRVEPPDIDARLRRQLGMSE